MVAGPSWLKTRLPLLLVKGLEEGLLSTPASCDCPPSLSKQPVLQTPHTRALHSEAPRDIPPSGRPLGDPRHPLGQKPS